MKKEEHNGNNVDVKCNFMCIFRILYFSYSVYFIFCIFRTLYFSHFAFNLHLLVKFYYVP